MGDYLTARAVSAITWAKSSVRMKASSMINFGAFVADAGSDEIEARTAESKVPAQISAVAVKLLLAAKFNTYSLL